MWITFLIFTLCVSTKNPSFLNPTTTQIEKSSCRVTETTRREHFILTTRDSGMSSHATLTANWNAQLKQVYTTPEV